MKARDPLQERLRLIRIEILRATHRPFVRFWFAWSALVSVWGALQALGWRYTDAGSIMLVGARYAALFGVVPAIGLGLVAGMDDARCHVAKDLHLAGMKAANDVLARMLVSAGAAVVLWLLGVASAMAVSLALAAVGRATLSTAGAGAHSSGYAATTTVGIGAVTLPLLASLSVVSAAALRSSARAAVLALTTVGVWFVSVAFINTSPSLLWIARFTPVGAALQLSTLSTFYNTDERFSVSRSIAVAAAVIWFLLVPCLAVWSLRRRPLERDARESMTRRTPRGDTKSGTGSPGGAPKLRRFATVALLAILTLGAISQSRFVRGKAPADSVYQWISSQRQKDVMERVVAALQEGRWDEASSEVGADIRVLAPDLVAYVESHPGARLTYLWSRTDGLGSMEPSIEVTTFRKLESGGYGWSGPAFFLHMQFSEGRWRLQSIENETR